VSLIRLNRIGERTRIRHLSGLPTIRPLVIDANGWGISRSLFFARRLQKLLKVGHASDQRGSHASERMLFLTG
jgi:hypothetical protein